MFITLGPKGQTPFPLLPKPESCLSEELGVDHGLSDSPMRGGSSVTNPIQQLLRKRLDLLGVICPFALDIDSGFLFGPPRVPGSPFELL